MTILAGGSRLSSIRRNGLVLENAATGARSTTLVPVLEQFPMDEAYDVAIVTVRRDQLPGIVPDLAGLGISPLCCSCLIFRWVRQALRRLWGKNVFCQGFPALVARYKMGWFPMP